MTTPAGQDDELLGTSAPVQVARVVEKASIAVFVVFFLNGFNFASWAARLPAIRDGLGFDPAQMGLLLLVGAVGSLVALPLSGMVIERLGARRTVLAFAILNGSGLVVASIGVALGEVAVVALGLVLFGVGTGVWDASMNVEGAVVEQHLGRTIMPRYHAGFSFGTVAAAGIAAVAAWLHVPVVVHIPIAVVLSVVGVAFAVRAFLPAADEPEVRHSADRPDKGARGALAAWLEPRTLLIGLVVLAAALTEGSANDWVSLAVVDGFDVPHALGALTFAIFVTAMTGMRWFGTTLLDRYGRVAILRLCAALSIVGLVDLRARRPPLARGRRHRGLGCGCRAGLPRRHERRRRRPDPRRRAGQRRLDHRVQRVPRRAAADRPARPARRVPARAAGHRRARGPGSAGGERGRPAQAARASLIACRPS